MRYKSRPYPRTSTLSDGYFLIRTLRTKAEATKVASKVRKDGHKAIVRRVEPSKKRPNEGNWFVYYHD